MGEKPKIVMIGSAGIGRTAATQIIVDKLTETHDIEIITAAEAAEKGFPEPEPIPIIARPLMIEQNIFTPPPTRAERRAKARKKR